MFQEKARLIALISRVFLLVYPVPGGKCGDPAVRMGTEMLCGVLPGAGFVPTGQ